MVGCYGNKGVVFKVVLIEDMLFFVDGMLVDLVLNLLGVFLCMNVGQILEVYMGWVSCGFGIKIDEVLDEYCCNGDMMMVCDVMKNGYGDEIYSMIFVDMVDEDLVESVKVVCMGVLIVILVFDGVKEVDINNVLKCVGFNELGQFIVFDGCMGEFFVCLVIVGVKYFLKLYYFVDDKMYVCLIGFYSFVMQQLLGGKVQFGGQCLGEMEVWVLEVYGVVYIL